MEKMKAYKLQDSYGRITVRHRGGGNRKKYRIIDFKRQKFDVEGTVKTLEYDPNRSAFIALVEYTDGEKAYIIAPEGLKVGDKVTAGANADIKPGNALPLTAIPVGTFIHNVELYPGRGAQLARSAGNMAQLMAKENGLALLRLPSGELRNVPENCMATIGQVGNTDHENVKIGKAGRKRNMGWRPTVRGSVMNPNDHPHGLFPSSVPFLILALKISPVEMCGISYFAAIFFAWVPLPAPGAPNIIIFIWRFLLIAF